MESTRTTKPLSVVSVGAHPDDPEESSFGTLVRYSEAGHRVTVIYLTRGERGIAGQSLEQAAEIRTAEAEAACGIIGAKPVFAGQIDGDTEVNRQRITAFSELLFAQRPDLVITHWPIDTHADHLAASFLTQRAYLTSPRPFRLYFFEVHSGFQTLGFVPQVYVDIAATRGKKQAALFCHKSQHGEEIYRKHHELIERFRGREIGTEAAEAFAPMTRDTRLGGLPGLEKL
jgi:LmbE family N-acetylglucosaminyl deacetylase